MKLDSYRRLVAAGGLYDLVVSAPFATPWTARAVLDTMARLHEALQLGGAPARGFAPAPLVFVAFFGTIVTLWSLVRIVYRRPVDGGIDALGRVAFASWMVWGLAQGASHILGGFLVLELGFAIAQGVGYLRLAPRERAVAAA